MDAIDLYTFKLVLEKKPSNEHFLIYLSLGCHILKNTVHKSTLAKPKVMDLHRSVC